MKLIKKFKDKLISSKCIYDINNKDYVKSNTYSETETIVGTYNGKTLYRKVLRRLNVAIVSGTNRYDWDLTDINIDEIINDISFIQIYLTSTQKYQRISDNAWSNSPAHYAQTFTISSSDLNEKTKANFYLILEYTKID